MGFLDRFRKRKSGAVLVDNRMEIGGRVFVAMREFSFEHEAFTLQHVREANLDRVVIQEGEDAESFSLRVLVEAIAAGKVFVLLGCFWVPEGEEWSPDVAISTGETFKRVTDETEKALLRSALAGMLQVFLVGGLTSLTISRTYSEILTETIRPAETAAR